MRKIVYSFVLIGLMVSCTAVRVQHDYDHNFDFSKARTYGFDSEMNSGLSDLDHKRLVRILDSTMVSRGYTYSETPAFLIDLKSEVYREQNGQNVGVGLGGGGTNVGGGVSIGFPLLMNNQRRIITFRFSSFEENELIWEANTDASFRENFSPQEREDQLRKVVFKALSKFPPN